MHILCMAIVLVVVMTTYQALIPHSITYSVCSDGDILPLVGGSTASEGYVQVCMGGRFTAVSLETTTVVEANVICRQLGLGSGTCIV